MHAYFLFITSITKIICIVVGSSETHKNTELGRVKAQQTKQIHKCAPPDNSTYRHINHISRELQELLQQPPQLQEL